MWLLITALGILFAAAVLVVIVIRVQTDAWPADLPPLPWTLWVSTGVLIASAGTMRWALISIRRDRPQASCRALLCTVVLALLFLILQVVAWFQWTGAVEAAGDLVSTHQLASSTFLLMTGVHALHVVGGLVALGWICGYAILRGYTADDHVAIRDAAMYWHFLDAVWIILVIFMLVLL